MSEEEFPKVSLVCVAVPLSPITAGQAATEMLQEKKKGSGLSFSWPLRVQILHAQPLFFP